MPTPQHATPRISTAPDPARADGLTPLAARQPAPAHARLVPAAPAGGVEPVDVDARHLVELRLQRGMRGARGRARVRPRLRPRAVAGQGRLRRRDAVPRQRHRPAPRHGRPRPADPQHHPDLHRAHPVRLASAPPREVRGFHRPHEPTGAGASTWSPATRRASTRCSGSRPIEHDLRYEMADEFCTFMRRLWTEDENLTVDGRWWRMKDAFVAPKPASRQRAHGERCLVGRRARVRGPALRPDLHHEPGRRRPRPRVRGAARAQRADQGARAGARARGQDHHQPARDLPGDGSARRARSTARSWSTRIPSPPTTSTRPSRAATRRRGGRRRATTG